MSTFQVGFGRRIITPPIGTVLAGYPEPHAATRVNDDLCVNAIALRQNDTTTLLMSFDLCTVPDPICSHLRTAIQEATGIPEGNMILAAIHTHSGPRTFTIAGWGNADVSFIENILYPQAVAAAKEAVNALQPAYLGIGETLSDAGINRREPLPNGKIALGQNPNGPYDPRMRVLAFRAVNGEPIVNIIHFGAHPTATGNTPDITRDWPGYMTDRLEKVSGAPSVYVNGAQGDVGPRVSSGKTIGDLVQAREVGEIAGTDAVRAYRSISQFTEPALSIKNGELKLPYRPLLSLEEAEAGMAKLGDPEKLKEVNVTLYDKYKKIVEHHKSGKETLTEWVFPQTYIALDSIVFVPYPFEMFCEIALNQQKTSPFPHTLCLSNANGSQGYMPTKDQIPLGGYEEDSFYAHFFQLEDEAGEQIVKENNRLLEALFG